MNRAIAYGLMGAAQGFLGGLHQEWQQNQEDIRTQKLLEAKQREQMAVTQMAHQYQSAENLQKFQLQLDAQDHDAANKAALAGQKQTFDARQNALNRTSLENRTATSANAGVEAATIRAKADRQPKALGDAIYQNKDGSYTKVAGGDTPPTGARLVVTSGGSIGPYQRQQVAPVGLLNQFTQGQSSGSGQSPPTSATDGGSVVPPPAPTAQPGSSMTNPIDIDTLTAPPASGTWVRQKNGMVQQYLGQGQ